jgi:hypothetical protein
MLLSEEMDYPMTSLSDVKGNIDVQVKQEDINDGVSLHGVTPCLQPKTSPPSYSTPPRLAATSTPTLSAHRSMSAPPRNESFTG